jgi:hypothetical protein
MLAGGAVLVVEADVALVDGGVAFDAFEVAAVAPGVVELVFGVAAVAPEVAAEVLVAVPGIVAAVVGACGALGGNIPPLKVTVLKWQLLQGALVMGWFGVLPTAILLLWQLAQGPSAWT